MNNKFDISQCSDLLEKYLIGQTSESETEIIEGLINTNPQVSAAYEKMQCELELVSQVNGVEPPAHLLANILSEIDEKPVVKLQPNTNANTKPERKRTWASFAVAASVAALLFGATSYKLYQQNQQLISENQVIVDEIFDLRTDISSNHSTLDFLRTQLDQLNNPETEKYVLKGDRRAKNLKTVVYINSKEKTSKLDVVSLPTLQKEQCYQIWADIQGKMVSLGILNEADRRLQNIPYTEDALGLSITIEPKGGSTEVSSDTPVAEISLKQLDD